MAENNSHTSTATMPVKAVDKVEILTLLDNSIDILLPDTDKAKRVPRKPDSLSKEPLQAEHGFSALVTVTADNSSETILFERWAE